MQTERFKYAYVSTQLEHLGSVGYGRENKEQIKKEQGHLRSMFVRLGFDATICELV